MIPLAMTKLETENDWWLARGRKKEQMVLEGQSDR
jgi:hypothetical protein